MLWADLQEAFYLLLGPYIVGLLLPIFGATCIVLAVLMAAAKYWRPLERVAVIWGRQPSDDVP